MVVIRNLAPLTKNKETYEDLEKLMARVKGVYFIIQLFSVLLMFRIANIYNIFTYKKQAKQGAEADLDGLI